MSRETIERIAGTTFFVAFIAAHFFLGIVAAVRVAGIACIVTGAVWAAGRSVPVGIENRPPSFFLRGAGAVLAGAVIAALGVVLMVYSHQAACVLGWVNETECR
jgi:hypothetical protein